MSAPTETEQVERNGTAEESAEAVEPSRFDVDFPVDRFRDAALHLRRPFTAQAVKFKVQATWPKSDPAQGLVVAYIDARLVADRLNLVCPHLWFDEYDPIDGGRMMCRLTVDGIVRRDIGEGYQGKGLYSDALKRAAVKFGVGVSLYAIPKIVLSKSDGHLRELQTKQGKSLALTVQGEARCREVYESWLERQGEAAFGPALGHGDAEGAVGDAEAEASVVEEGDAPATIGRNIAKKMVDRVWPVAAAKKSLQLAASHAAERDVGDCSTKAKATTALASLTYGQAEKLDRWITKKAEGGDEDGE